MARKYNISIDQGTNYSLSLSPIDNNNTLIDITNFNIKASIKKSYYSLNSYDFNSNLSNSTSINLYMGSSATKNIENGRYVYDIIGVSNTGVVYRFYEGVATINPSVTVS